MPYGCQGQQVKGQGHNAVITNFLWRITVFPLHLQSSNFTHRFPVSQESCLTDIGVKSVESLNCAA